MEAARRFEAVKESARVPDECGPAIIAAPARGACVVVRHQSLVPQGVDGRGLTKWAAAPSGYGHRASVRAADVFDRMIAQARRRQEPAPLTPGQISMARRYRGLWERHQAGGVKLSNLDGAQRGDGSGRDFMDAYLAEGREIEAIRRRIGSGVAMAVRRVRPSERGSRSNILDRALVDLICLGDHQIDQVLRAHGWSPKGATRKAARAALCAALDRMAGYSDQKGG